MARGIIRSSAQCRKLLPLAISLALLVASASYQTLAQADTSSPASGSASGGSGGGSSGGSNGSGSGGGLLSAITGGSQDGGASAQLSSPTGSGSGSSPSGSTGSTPSPGNSAQISGNIGGVSGSLSLGTSASSSSSSSSGSGSSGSTGSGSSLSSSGSSSSSTSSATASLTLEMTSTTAKPEGGLLSKMKDMVKSSVESFTKEEKSSSSSSESQSSGSSSTSSGGSGSSSGSDGSRGGLFAKIKENAKEAKEDVKAMMKGEERRDEHNEKKEGPVAKFMDKVKDKASDLGLDKIKKPIQESAIAINKGTNAMTGGQGRNPEDKGLVVELLDKSHDLVKEPFDKALKPIDKALGIKEDPLLKMYDATHDKLRHPISLVAKPVDTVFKGAFRTSEEAKKDAEKYLSEQERKLAKQREDRLKKEGRSILGEITDKSVELFETPIEIILKPVDRLLGLDKKRSPILQIIDDIYGFSKKPIDTFARPLEEILRKMGDDDKNYQVSVRLQGDSVDPKLVTRLADGTINVAERLLTKPIELAMRPLGYGNNRKNPLVSATHSLKNATKLGVELFTRPIDRIIKEIAELGAITDDAELEALMERKRHEASRLVYAWDKLHDAAEQPFEIVLRPVGKVLGYNKEGKREKEPLLRAWDVIHQVFRTPIQVVSRPVEDAILGAPDRTKQPLKHQLKGDVRPGQHHEERRNFLTDQIRKIERFAARPLEKFTSPIRKLILGDDFKGSTKASVGGLNARISADGEEDKIVKSIEELNNVVLKPLEEITQPIADILAPSEKSHKNENNDKGSRSSMPKIDAKAPASGPQQKGGSRSSAPTSSSLQQQIQAQQQQLQQLQQQQLKGASLTASAQIKSS